MSPELLEVPMGLGPEAVRITCAGTWQKGGR